MGVSIEPVYDVYYQEGFCSFRDAFLYAFYDELVNNKVRDHLENNLDNDDSPDEDELYDLYNKEIDELKDDEITLTLKQIKKIFLTIKTDTICADSHEVKEGKDKYNKSNVKRYCHYITE